MSFPRSINLAVVLLASFAGVSAFADPLSKSEANQIIPEGEYLVRSGRRVHALNARHSSSQRFAANAITPPKRKKRKAATERYPASVSRKKSPKHSAKRRSKTSPKHAAKKPHSRKSERRRTASSKKPPRHFAVARETKNERDMPFVSIPHRRVGSADRTIVMEDPVKRPTLKPSEKNVLDPSFEGPPSAVGAAKAADPSIVGPAPASVAIESGTPVAREPDAFDLHSGQDPMRGP